VVSVENEPEITPVTEEETSDIFKAVPAVSSSHFENLQHVTLRPDSSQKTNKRLVDAISDGLKLAMRKHDNLVLMGQDIAEYGGVFKITQAFVEEFGKARVRNTPLCESAISWCRLWIIY
jgi:2-oxoisovalerate dehydrogenase E1 component